MPIRSSKHLFALALLPLAASAQVNTVTDTLMVTAEVLEACTVTAASLDFGADFARNVADDQTVNITANCAMGVAYTLELGYGLRPAGTQRRVSSIDVGDRVFMDYDLFKPSAGAGSGAATNLLWGTNAMQAGSGISATGTGSNQVFTATGRLGRLAGKAVGIYTDQVLVTLSY